ncbi:GlcG/HbpS family heme-binding protein [Pseudomonas akapageensis]|uniref:GlcG/HbpS family heme-binding protein n=1 Tax=Pseudomonas akapageensis TaxID=2609961 RepID=UPI00140A33A3|nr:heme-binding protein [Pseudomonas akapageensis]
MRKVQPKSSLTLEAAQFLAQTAIEKATALGLRINAVVVDVSGDPLVSLRMSGAPLPARDFAEKKAYTAAAYGWPTSRWKPLLEARPVITAGLTQHPRVALFAGGMPVLVEGQVVGAIGVAGSKEDQDEVCAQAAVDAFSLQ